MTHACRCSCSSWAVSRARPSLSSIASGDPSPAICCWGGPRAGPSGALGVGGTVGALAPASVRPGQGHPFSRHSRQPNPWSGPGTHCRIVSVLFVYLVPSRRWVSAYLLFTPPAFVTLFPRQQPWRLWEQHDRGTEGVARGGRARLRSKSDESLHRPRSGGLPGLEAGGSNKWPREQWRTRRGTAENGGR